MDGLLCVEEAEVYIHQTKCCIRPTWSKSVRDCQTLSLFLQFYLEKLLLCLLQKIKINFILDAHALHKIYLGILLSLENQTQNSRKIL